MLGIYSEKNMIQRDACTPMFTAALFIIAKTQKQPKYPSTHLWIKKMWYTYTVEYYPAIKKNEIMLFAFTWMDPEVVILNEVSKTEKEKYLMTSLTCGIQKIVIQMNLFAKQKQTHRHRGKKKKKLWLP